MFDKLKLLNATGLSKASFSTLASLTMCFGGYLIAYEKDYITGIIFLLISFVVEIVREAFAIYAKSHNVSEDDSTSPQS